MKFMLFVKSFCLNQLSNTQRNEIFFFFKLNIVSKFLILKVKNTGERINMLKPIIQDLYQHDNSNRISYANFKSPQLSCEAKISKKINCFFLHLRVENLSHHIISTLYNKNMVNHKLKKISIINI